MQNLQVVFNTKIAYSYAEVMVLEQKDLKEALGRLYTDIELLSNQMAHWKSDAQRQFTGSMAVTPALESWCGGLLYLLEQIGALEKGGGEKRAPACQGQTGGTGWAEMEEGIKV